MNEYIVFGKIRFNDQAVPLKKVRDLEKSAVGIAQRIYRDYKMSKVIVIDQNLKAIFTVERKCKCERVQMVMLDIEGSLGWKCEDCGLVHDQEPKFKELVNEER